VVVVQVVEADAHVRALVRVPANVQIATLGYNCQVLGAKT
jgi:hypothetical protein